MSRHVPPLILPGLALPVVAVPALAVPAVVPAIVPAFAIPAPAARTGVPTAWQMALAPGGAGVVGPGSIGVSVTHSWQWANPMNVGCDVKELISVAHSDGCFANAGITVQRGWEDGDNAHVPDQHGAPTAMMTSEGYHRALQIFVYQNDNVGQTVVPGSGYEIIRQVLRLSASIFLFKVRVRGASATVNGLFSGPGNGDVSYERNIHVQSAHVGWR